MLIAAKRQRPRVSHNRSFVRDARAAGSTALFSEGMRHNAGSDSTNRNPRRLTDCEREAGTRLQAPQPSPACVRRRSS